MKVILTCGSSYDPIDEVRRITNFSTGELGVQLCNALARAGFEVFCFKGSGAMFPGPGQECHLSLFDTNDDPLELLTQTSASHDIAAVFHVAALCDYKVKRVENDQGRGCQSAKIASRSGALTINLEPATKVIGKMRELFPESILVGWKYELVGTRNDALAKAGRQIEENRTDACVLNPNSEAARGKVATRASPAPFCDGASQPRVADFGVRVKRALFRPWFRFLPAWQSAPRIR